MGQNGGNQSTESLSYPSRPDASNKRVCLPSGTIHIRSGPPSPTLPHPMIHLKVTFQSSSIAQLIEHYSMDISKQAIFIRTREPLPIGTSLYCEFQLADGTPLLSGEGTVVLCRVPTLFDLDRPPGMAVRFDRLTAESRQMFLRILVELNLRGELERELHFNPHYPHLICQMGGDREPPLSEGWLGVDAPGPLRLQETGLLRAVAIADILQEALLKGALQQENQQRTSVGLQNTYPELVNSYVEESLWKPVDPPEPQPAAGQSVFSVAAPILPASSLPSPDIVIRLVSLRPQRQRSIVWPIRAAVLVLLLSILLLLLR